MTRKGTVGFGNAGEVVNLLDASKARSAARIQEERLDGGQPDIFLLVRDDLLGPKTTKEYIESCEAYQELFQMTGLKSVKRIIRVLADMMLADADREERGEQPRPPKNNNRLFLGNPGTGKTTVAKLYAQILKHFRLLSKGDFKKKAPKDFIGAVVGESTQKTARVLKDAEGCFLLVDEAYGLSGSSGDDGGLKEGGDTYKVDAINALVDGIQVGQDMTVVFAGYTEPMNNLMKMNDGLRRRFATDPFLFEDYTNDELRRILAFKLKKLNLRARGDCRNAAMKVLEEQRRLEENFGNAGAIDNLLDSATQRMQERLGSKVLASNELVAADFGSGKGSGEVDEAFIGRLFADLIGGAAIKEQV
jgi:AAA+ superfamily predicted ATPase